MGSWYGCGDFEWDVGKGNVVVTVIGGPMDEPRTEAEFKADAERLRDLIEEWVSAEWEEADLLQVLRVKGTGRRIFLAGGVLKDGTVLYGCAFAGGQRVFRCGPHNDWAIEERFSGQPASADRAAVNDVYRMYVDSLIESKREAERELGPPPKLRERKR